MNEKEGFFERVYEVVKQIPYGRVTTYGMIAKVLGMSRSARMVGWALKATHGDLDIPVHRVVNKQGLLTGKHHFYGKNMMQQLLENEGIEVVDNKIIHLDRYLWEPSIGKTER